MFHIRIIESISDKLDAMLYAVEEYPGFRLYHYGAKARAHISLTIVFDK